MGLLVDGKWMQKEPTRANNKGEYIRPVSPFRHFIKPGDNNFPSQSDRYHLFVNAGCPWAYRTILYRSIKGLSELIGITFTEAAAGQEGWTFGDEPESQLGAQFIHDIYTLAQDDYSGRATVPVLWDKQNQTIVNNESADIIRMFNTAFDDFDGVVQVDYYPASLRTEVNRLNEEIYANVNNGVYRCGFAQSEEAYNTAFEQLFATLDSLDERLSKQRYLCGDSITEADWRLFATLIRFDLAYHGQFRCNRNRLVDFEHLWPYTRDLIQQPAVAETVDIQAIKGIYYGSRPPFIIPGGPAINFTLAHGRDRNYETPSGR